MSKINELIQTLCPDGVEYKKLGEVATNMFRGNGIKRDEVTENGTPCVRYGEIYTTYDIWFDTCVSHTDVDGLKSPKYFGYGAVLIAITGESVLDIAKSTVYVGHERCLAGGDILVVEHEQNPKYMGYVLSTTDAQDQKRAGKIKSKVVHASAKDLAEITIPVPPLPVQEEIVRILDEYTELEAELEAKLSEEIELKQKQYEVYRDELLNDDAYDGYTLPEISENCDNQRKPITSSQRVSGSTPYYGASGIVDYVDGYIFDGEYLLISEDGANLLARSTPIAFSISGRTWVNNHAHILKFENYYTQKWVEYYFNSIDLSLYVTGGAQPKLNQKNLNKIVIPVPSLQEQQRIVKILDSFNESIQAMISTLNTELESRKKQYAYYRDQLLTFKRKE